VHDAATCLIDIYLETGNYVDAERFARVTYECLIGPRNNTNRKSKLFALGMLQIARIWSGTPSDHRVGGSEEAETLAREYCDILENLERSENINDPVALCLSESYGVLGKVMIERGKRDIEVENTLLKGLSFSKDCRVGVVPNVQGSLLRFRHLQLLASFHIIIARDALTGCCDVGLIENSKVY
jgi:hypothetical protein